MNRIFYLSILIFVIAGCSESKLDQNTVRNEIISANSELESAYLNSNASSVAEMMTDEVIISPVQLHDLNGREEVESILSQLFKTAEVLQYSLTPNELDVFEDVVYERGTYVWISVVGGDTTTTNGRYSAVRHLDQDGKWRIHRLIENTIPSN